MRQRNWLLRAGGALLAVAALAVSAYVSIAGVLYRREPDTRSLASAYIAEHVPVGATLALASTTSANPWTTHQWRYPRIDTLEYSLAPILENPDYIITTSYALNQMERGLASGHLDPNFEWPAELANRWYKYRVPRPEEFIFFNSLLKEESYFVQAKWENPPPVSVEFPAPEIRLYRRADGSAAP